MSTFWDKIVSTAEAMRDVWSGQYQREAGQYTKQDPSMQSPFSIYVGLEEQYQERIKRNNLLWNYYHGRHKKHLKARMTPAGPGPDDNVIINISRRVVNKGAAFLFGEPLDWELAETDGTPEEKLLDSIWISPEWRMGFLNELAINGGVTGDFYVQIQPSPTPLGLPRLINLDPNIVIPYWNPDDIDEIWAYEMRYRMGKTVKRTIYSLTETKDNWEIITESFTAGKWTMDEAPKLWGLPWSPIIHGKNLPNPNEFFGLSDLEDADINDAINAASSNMNRVIRIFAHPVIWGKMFSQGDLDVSKIAMSSNKDATMDALQLASDLSSSQEYIKFLRTMFSEITQVPETDPDRMAIGAQSGFALKVLFHDLVQKTNIKRALYGREIIEINRRLLDLMNRGPENVVKLHWQSALPEDQREQVSSDTFDLTNDLASKETISAARGYDWETEQERIKAEKQATQADEQATLVAANRIMVNQGM